MLPADLVIQVSQALQLMSLCSSVSCPSPLIRTEETKHGHHIIIAPFEHLSNYEIIYAQAVLAAAINRDPKRDGCCDWKREAMNYRRFRQGYVNNVLFEP